MLYLPAPGSPGPPVQEDKKESSDSEEDTLDAFMSNLVNIICLLIKINIGWYIFPFVYNSNFFCDIFSGERCQRTGCELGIEIRQQSKEFKTSEYSVTFTKNIIWLFNNKNIVLFVICIFCQISSIH